MSARETLLALAFPLLWLCYALLALLSVPAELAADVIERFGRRKAFVPARRAWHDRAR